MAQDQQFLDSVQAIDQAFGPQAGDAEAAGASIENLCELYRKIKGPLDVIIPVVEMIPVYGKTIAKALRLLKQFGSVACPG